MGREQPQKWLAGLLLAYVSVLGVGALLLVAINFPSAESLANEANAETALIGFTPFGNTLNEDQVLLLLAFFAGMAGGFLHAAPSLVTYVGNQKLVARWLYWYLARPWIGGTLGVVVYLVIRAGLVSGSSIPNAFGIVAVAFLSGWFSKQATDKMEEVFVTLLRADADKLRKDKLREGQPNIGDVRPDPVPFSEGTLAIEGDSFVDDSVVLIDGNPVHTVRVSSTELTATLNPTQTRGAKVTVQVLNPAGTKPRSNVALLQLEGPAASVTP